MRVNSLIWLKAEQPLNGTETGFDADGNPVSSTPHWLGDGLLADENGYCVITEFGAPVYVQSAPLQAFTEILSENRRAQYEDGKYRAAKYRIHIEIPKLLEPFEPTRLKLCRQGEDLGEFAVISCQRLPVVGRIEIIV